MAKGVHIDFVIVPPEGVDKISEEAADAIVDDFLDAAEERGCTAAGGYAEVDLEVFEEVTGRKVKSD